MSSYFMLSYCLMLTAVVLIAGWGGGVELHLCWLFAMAHVRSTARPISDAAAGGAGDGGDGFEERIVSA
jgi:hypothetical protein